VSQYLEHARARATELLSNEVARAREVGLDASMRLIEAPVAESLVAVAEELSADCILVGSHGRTGLGRWWFGSVAERVVRLAHCRTLVVRSDTPLLDAGRIVVGDDLTVQAQAARRTAIELAAAAKKGVTVVHSLDIGIPYLSTVEVVVPNDVFDDLYRRAREQLDLDAKKTPDVDIENLVVGDRAGDALCDHAKKAGTGLVVVGTRGRYGVERTLLGSVAERVVRHAPCSVLVVPAEDEEAA
jgi:nucleotide-binding universal stress UspA family protein